MKKATKKKAASDDGGIVISGLGNARIVSRGNKVTVDGVDSNIEQVNVVVSSPSPQVLLRNVSNDSVVTVNGKRFT